LRVFAQRSRHAAPSCSICSRTRPTSCLAPSTDLGGRCGAARQIEQVFAELKTLLRIGAKRTMEGLWRAIGRALEAFTPAECTPTISPRRLCSIKLETLVL
jgi:hypothetical protein